jgi:putative DNA primase/helicase
LGAALLDGPDDGLVARFLWAWPDKLAFSRPRRPADLAALEQAYRRLDRIGWGQGLDGRQAPIVLSLETSAADVFEDWQRDNSSADLEASGLYGSFVGKMDGTVLRLALIAELSAWAFIGGDEPRDISARSLVAAAGFVDDYAKPMAQRVYGDAALPKVERDAAILARYLISLGEKVINKRRLSRSPHKSEHGLRGDALANALDHLEAGDWVRDSSGREGETIGRKRQDYTINPRIFEAAS